MPDHDTHDLFDFYMFGCAMGQFRWVHQLLDHPWINVFGAEHRKVMHDAKTIAWIESQYGPMAALVAKGHIACDIAFSSLKRKGGEGGQ